MGRDPFKHQDDDGTNPPMDARAAPNCLHPEVQERLGRMELGIYEIKSALVGNRFQKGVVPRLDAVEEKVETHDRKIYLWSALGTTIGGAAVFFIDWLKRK